MSAVVAVLVPDTHKPETSALPRARPVAAVPPSVNDGPSSPPPQAASVAANVRPKANFVNLTLVTGNFCIFKPLFKLMN